MGLKNNHYSSAQESTHLSNNANVAYYSVCVCLAYSVPSNGCTHTHTPHPTSGEKVPKCHTVVKVKIPS